MGAGGYGGDRGDRADRGDQWARRGPPRRRPGPPVGRTASGEWGAPSRRPRPDPRLAEPWSPYRGVGASGRDSSGSRRIPDGVRFAEPVRTWQLPKRLPTTPTLLAGGAAVLLAFLIGHVTGGSSTSVATSNTTASVATTTTLPPVPTSHTVAPGETLSSIAGALSLTTAQLASYNGISNLNHVFVGEVLKIPPPTSPTSTSPATTSPK
jgi:LysM repeat protein